MSAPSELRVLCHQLSSTPVAHLPQITPLLLRNVLRCRAPLSAPSGNAAKADASETSVLVHKLKTHVSTLLNGKNIEGKFVAIVLIKGLVDVGGWEVLRTAEPWVRGLLAIVTKPQDPIASKKLAIITLTAIYVQTHQYQSLLREITTPTLPTFVTSSLNLIVSKSSGKVTDVPASLVEAIFESFSTLMPRHPAIFRPFAGQIRIVTRAYVAPTFTDARFVPESLKETARTLAVLVHQTAPKNTSGEEWGKGIRAVVKEIHSTTDEVFRAVVEDWESSVGYIPQPVDVNKELSGGGPAKEDYPAWTGIDAGLERLTGLVSYLSSHFTKHTATQVTVPLGIIDDLLSRLMSIAPPLTNAKSGSEHGAMRLHPGIRREEREALWAGLPAIHMAVMSAYSTLVTRFNTSFVSLAQGALEHIVWTFRTSKEDEAYRTIAYKTLAHLLPLCGSSLPKASVDRFTPVLRAICSEVRPEDTKVATATIKDIHGKATTNGVANADNFLKSTAILSPSSSSDDTAVVAAAKALLPSLYTHLSQSNLEAYLRAELDRTAILTHNREAMIASVMNPFLGKNGKSLPSIMPHLCRAYPRDAAVEALLRPRMPVIRESRTVMNDGYEEPTEEEDEDFVMGELAQDDEDVAMDAEATATKTVTSKVQVIEEVVVKQDVWGTTNAGGEKKALPVKKMTRAVTKTAAVAKLPEKVVEVEEDSDDESVHLEAGLSESEEEEDDE